MSNKTPDSHGKALKRNQFLSGGARLIVEGDFATTAVTTNRVLNADNVDSIMYIANRKMQLVGFSEVHATAGTDGSAVTLQIERLQGTESVTNGDSLLSSTINLKGTANTVQAGVLTTTEALLVLEAGDRLSLNYTGTITSLAGVVVTVDLIPA